MRRVAPAIVLFFLSPLVAEFLLGDLTVTQLPALVGLAPIYGGGAVLIREVTRRAGRGWPTMLLLALAYGLVEEGLATQSLFNPDYAGAHLLDHGFVPALGIAVPWTIFVLALHVVWSIGAPIAVVEALWPSTRPWLRAPGTVAATVLFLVGVTAVTAISYSDGHFVAPASRLATVAVLVVLSVAAAFLLPRARTAGATVDPAPAWSPWLVLVLALALLSAFMGVDLIADRLAWWLVCLFGVAMLTALAWLVLAGSRRAGWGRPHRLAVAAAALLTYSWHSFTMGSLQHDASATQLLVSHVVLAALAVALLAVTALRSARPSTVESAARQAEPASR